MRAVRTLESSVTPCVPAWSEALIALDLGDGQWRLDNGRAARCALSCLVEPETGDSVLVAASREGRDYIVHVLARPEARDVRLSVPGARAMLIRQARVDISATEGIAVRSMRDLELTASSGVLALSARNLFATAAESIVDNARHYVGRIGDYMLDIASLLQMRGRQAMLTADRDIKMDAERISMG